MTLNIKPDWGYLHIKAVASEVHTSKIDKLTWLLAIETLLREFGGVQLLASSPELLHYENEDAVVKCPAHALGQIRAALSGRAAGIDICVIDANNYLPVLG